MTDEDVDVGVLQTTIAELREERDRLQKDLESFNKLKEENSKLIEANMALIRSMPTPVKDDDAKVVRDLATMSDTERYDYLKKEAEASIVRK